METVRSLFSSRLAAVAAAIALLVACILVPYRPVLREGPKAPPGPYELRAAVRGLRLHVFQTGMNRMSSLLVGSRRPWRPVPAFVLERPGHGLVVFDTGLPEAVASKGEVALGFPTRLVVESRSLPGRSLDAQMRADGLSPEDVGTVILSHLHEDHLGAAGAFDHARFIGGRGTAGTRVEGRRVDWTEVDLSTAVALPPFDTTLDLFGDGSVTLIAGGGHSTEDLMAMVALPSGPVLLAGDAVVHRDWLESDDVQRIATDPDRAAVVRNAVRALLAERPDVVLAAGHDCSSLPRDRDDLVLHHSEWCDAAAWPVTP